MSVIGLVNQAVAWYAASAVLAFLFAMRKPLSGAIAGIGGAVASAMLVVAGGAALLMPERIHGGMLQFLHLTIRVGGVNALWLLAIGLSALPVSLFNISWHRHPQVKANGPLVNLLLAAATCAVVVTNIGSLVVMAEIMALCAAFLTGCAASGKLWFALGRLGTLLMARLAGWWCGRPTAPRAGADQSSGGGYDAEPAAWLPGLAGSPCWRGDPAARLRRRRTPGQRAGRRAVFHGGHEGRSVRHADRFVGRRGVPPLWWGVMLLLEAGMITPLSVGLYALMEHNIQRPLAYHTSENIGIILLGLGAFVTGVATRNSTLMVLGFIGGMYHLINHSLFKTTLFLGAGAVWFRTGHRDIEKLGGIGKKMPLISLAMLVGLMAMAALLPLKWLRRRVGYLSILLQMSTGDLFIGRLLGPLLAVGLAITGALAVMCMAKVYGVTFLGAPRTKEAENATCALADDPERGAGGGFCPLAASPRRGCCRW